MGRRVAITGIGAITSLGLDMQSTWKNVLAGKSGLGPLTACPAEDLEYRVAGQIHGFEPNSHFGHKEARHLDRAMQLGLVAAREAVASAGIQLAGPDTAVVMGTGMAGIITFAEQMTTFVDRGPRGVTPHFVPMMLPSMLASQIAITMEINGPSFEVSVACASGALAIAQAAELIAHGHVRQAIAGGAEAPLTRIGVIGLGRMGAMSRRNDDPEHASRPFDVNRDGFVLAEGSAALVLEEMDSALERGAPILAELIGWGMTGDAHHVTQPLADGTQAAGAMRKALRLANIRPEDVDYLNAHATATTLGDLAEVKAIRSVFAETAPNVAVSATKSMTGHLVGAAGALEAAFCTLAIKDGVIPPTINLDKVDRECELNHITTTLHKQVNIALSNSFGFGGHNVVLIVAKPGLS